MPFTIRPRLTSWLIVTGFFAAMTYMIIADAEKWSFDAIFYGLIGLSVAGFFLFLKPLVLILDRDKVILSWYGVKKQMPYEAITVITLIPVRIHFGSVFRFVNRFSYKLLFLLTAMPFAVGFVVLSMKSGLKAAWPLLLFMAALWLVLLIPYVLARRKIFDFSFNVSYIAMYIDPRYLDRFPFSYYRRRGITYGFNPIPSFKKGELKKLIDELSSRSPQTKISDDLMQYVEITP